MVFPNLVFTSSLVMRSLYEIPRSLRKHLISNACILLSMFAVMVHVSHAYKNIDMTRELISLIFELMATFLSFQMSFSLVTAAAVWAILESTSGLLNNQVKKKQQQTTPKQTQNKQLMLLLLVACLASQQHDSVSQRRQDERTKSFPNRPSVSQDRLIDQRGYFSQGNQHIHVTCLSRRAVRGRCHLSLPPPPPPLPLIAPACCCWLLFVVVCWLLNVPATWQCISGTDLLRQLYVLPHTD